MVFQLHIVHMVLQVIVKIREEYLKEKKWLVIWVTHQVTKQNLKIMDIDLNNNLIAIKGSVPGKKNSTVFIKDAIKEKK